MNPPGLMDSFHLRGNSEGRKPWFRSLGRLTLGILGSFLTLLPATEVKAQGSPPPLSRTLVGVGLVGNAPAVVAGIGGYVVIPSYGGIGIYFDAKVDVDDPSEDRGFDPSVTASQVEAQGGDRVKFESGWWSVNAALVRPVTPSLMVYGGGGYAHRKLYGLYNVPSWGEVGLGGVVWAESKERGGGGANFMAGIMMRLTARVTSHFGFETRPRGVTAGASLSFPGW